ncbi:MAG TPA: hypothetical protein VK737_08560 [Opitutales bacterium]|jgi:hypothetical protein|nr:hypothetical protein [Opitutales bacterium]
MRVGIQIFLLTAGFAGAYAGLRHIPASNCNFLHYEQTVVSGDGMTYCGSGAAYFVDLQKLPFPVSVTLTADNPPTMGVESHYTLQLVPNGDKQSPFRPSELAVAQTRKLHLLIVDASLEDYQHIHPEPVGDSGDWTFSFTPKRPGPYHVYAQFIPAISMREMIGETTITVPGSPAPAVNRGLTPFTDGDYTFKLSTPSGDTLPVGTDATLTLTVQRKDGGKVQLQPVMDTLAHLVAFDPSRDGVAHLHPTLTGEETNPTQPAVSFVINFTDPGHYRIWGQVALDGQERFVPFDVTVK